MDAKYIDVLTFVNQWFEKLFQKTNKPCMVQWGNGFSRRFKEKTIEQAIIQKPARVVSGLRAVM